MCRMMAAVSARGVEADLLARFRRQADARGLVGEPPGHHDGWGIVCSSVYAERSALAYAGRSPKDAATDQAYEIAVAEIAKARPRVVVAHVRAASVGGITLENTHPFLEDGWAFCHNGTVNGIAKPGETDSQALFARVLAHLRRGEPPEDALRSVAAALAPESYSSATCLLTNGRAVWGLRKLGEDPVECAADRCAPDHYTLGVAQVGGVWVVSQDREFLGIGADAWRVVPDGGVVRIAPGAEPQILAARP